MGLRLEMAYGVLLEHGLSYFIEEVGLIQNSLYFQKTRNAEKSSVCRRPQAIREMVFKPVNR